MIALLEPPAHAGLGLGRPRTRAGRGTFFTPFKNSPGDDPEVGIDPPAVDVAVEKAEGMAPAVKSEESLC